MSSLHRSATEQAALQYICANAPNANAPNANAPNAPYFPRLQMKAFFKITEGDLPLFKNGSRGRVVEQDLFFIPASTPSSPQEGPAPQEQEFRITRETVHDGTAASIDISQDTPAPPTSSSGPSTAQYGADDHPDPALFDMAYQFSSWTHSRDPSTTGIPFPIMRAPPSTHASLAHRDRALWSESPRDAVSTLPAIPEHEGQEVLREEQQHEALRDGAAYLIVDSTSEGRRKGVEAAVASGMISGHLGDVVRGMLEGMHGGGGVRGGEGVRTTGRLKGRARKEARKAAE